MPSPASTTPLQLEFATVEDVPELTHLWYNAFTDPAMLAIWPDTPGVRQWWDSANHNDMLNKPRAKYLKVIDTTQKGRIAAYAKWSLEPAEQRGRRFPPWHEDMNGESNEAYFQLLEASRARLVGGRKNFYLDMLVTHTDYRRKGAARLLIEWGCQMADQEDAAIYIDSSEDGKPIYERFGFEVQSLTQGLASMVREPRRNDA